MTRTSFFCAWPATLFALLAGTGCGSAPPSAPPSRAFDPNAACLSEGQGASQFSDHIAPTAGERPAPPCCPGLVKLDLFESTAVMGGQCLANKGGAYACLKCGDGTCGPQESACNCPSDCKP